MKGYNILGGDIKKMVTRFKYKKSDISFEILIEVDEYDDLLCVFKTNEYEDFKQEMNNMIKIRSENKKIYITDLQLNNSLGVRQNAA